MMLTEVPACCLLAALAAVAAATFKKGLPSGTILFFQAQTRARTQVQAFTKTAVRGLEFQTTEFIPSTGNKPGSVPVQV